MVTVSVRALQSDPTHGRVGVRKVGPGSVFSSDLDHSLGESALLPQDRDH
jgi:hypothetical protein